MLSRILLCLAALPLMASAQPPESNYAPGENWAWNYGGEEVGGGSSYLGVDIADVTPERLTALKLKEEQGAEVTMVDQDAPAGKAGLHEHDVILTLNGAEVESAAQLRRMIRETPGGRVVTLGLSRDGQPLTLKVQLANRGKMVAPGADAKAFKFEMPAMPVIPDFDLPVSVVIAHSSARSGLMVENITPQLGEFFGVKNGSGALVRSVEKGSRAEKAGFRAGDVIVKVNTQSVRDTSDFTHALRSASNNSASVTVIRDKKEQNLTLTLPDKKDSGILLEESFKDLPEVSADIMLEVGNANEEIARLRPEIEKLRGQLPSPKQMQQKLQDSQRKMQQQSEKLRHELTGDWTEI
jgi:membrane-associated protease RseP (regulator of RpoE activity)